MFYREVRKPPHPLDIPHRRAGIPQRHLQNLPRIAPKGPWGDAWKKIDCRLGQGSIIALLGPRGCGKTQLAVALAVQVILADAGCLLEESRLVRYVKAGEMFRLVRECYSNHDISETATIDSFVRPKLLNVDEAHERVGSDFEHRTLTSILDARYDALRDTVLIANMNNADFAQSIGPSVVSRIHETGECFWCDWPSFRKPPEKA